MATKRFSTKQKTVAAAVTSALLIGTGVLVFVNKADRESFETPNGEVVNMQAALTAAETAHQQFAMTGRAIHDDSHCFVEKVDAYLSGTFACGPVRENSSLYGSYDSVPVTYALNNEGEVEATVGESFEGGYTSTPGSILIRPDGLGALPASLMDYEVDTSLPEIPASALSEDGTVTGGTDGTTIQALYETAKGETLTLGDRSVFISEAGNASTIILDGIEYRATPGNVFTVIKTIPTEIMNPNDPPTDVEPDGEPSTQPGTDEPGSSGTSPTPGTGEPSEQPTAPGEGTGTTPTTPTVPGAPGTPGTSPAPGSVQPGTPGGSIIVGGKPVVAIPTTRVEAGAGGTGESTTVIMVPARTGAVGVQIVGEDGSELAWMDLRDPSALYGSPVSAGMLRGQGQMQAPITLSGVDNADSDFGYEVQISGYRIWSDDDGEIKFRLNLEGENWRYWDRGSSFGEVPGAGRSEWIGSVLTVDSKPVEGSPVIETYQSTGTDDGYDNDGVKSTVTRSLTWTLPDGDGREYVVTPSVKISTTIFDYLSNYEDGYGSGSYVDLNSDLNGRQSFEYVVPSSAIGQVVINATLGTAVPTVQPAEEAW